MASGLCWRGIVTCFAWVDVQSYRYSYITTYLKMIDIVQYRAAVGKWHSFCISRPLKSKSSTHTFSLYNFLKCFTVRPTFTLITSLLLLLIISGIEVNPGPIHTPLLISHSNVRSLCSDDRTKKIDELESLLCIERQCHLVCISETWLKHSIKDDDISISNYQIFRNDRDNQDGLDNDFWERAPTSGENHMGKLLESVRRQLCGG